MPTRAKRRALTTLGALIVAFTVALPTTAYADTTIPPPPPNPSDDQVAGAQAQADSAAAQVGTLNGQVTKTQNQIDQLQDDMQLKQELVKKAMIDQQVAEQYAAETKSEAAEAQQQADAAAGAITDAEDQAAQFAAASYRNGSVLGSITSFLDASSLSDVFAREQLIDQVGSSQAAVLDNLKQARTEKTNLDSDAKLAADQATAAAAAAVQKEKDSETAQQQAADALSSGQQQLTALQAQLAQQQQQYETALNSVSDLKSQQQAYQAWAAAKAAEEEREREEAAAAAQKRAEEQAAAQAAAAKAAADQAAAEQAAAEQAAQQRAAAQLQAEQIAQAQAAAAALQAQPNGAAAASTPTSAVYYASCDDVVLAGKAPLGKDQPGYRTELDRNGNGVACEVLGDGGGSTTAAAPSSSVNNGVASSRSDAGSSSPGVWSAAKGQAAVDAAMRWLGTPYSWGGGNTVGPTTGICGPDGAENDCHVVGFDCSGLTSYAWAQVGIAIPAYSVYQYTLGQHISVANLLPGDLLFYANNTSRPSTIHHVAMYIGNGQMIEAPYSGAYVHTTNAKLSGQFIGATRPGT